MATEKNDMKKATRILFILFLTLFILCIFAACSNKSHYKEGYTYVVYKYNDAEGYEDGTEYVKNGETILLPTPHKEGYAFIGWECDGDYTVRDSVPTDDRDELTLKAEFERDYTGISAPCALFYGGYFHEYNGKAFPQINKRVTDIYVNGGYKVIVYARKNFKGHTNTLTYKSHFNGHVGSIEIKPITSNEDDYTTLGDDEKAALLKKYAPRFYWASGEKYFACDVDDAVRYLTRTKCARGYYYEVPGITDPDFENAFLRGDLSTAKVYAYAVEKEVHYLDLGYFVFCPYNKGKKMVGTYYGNHVGDWEHITVRLMVTETDGGVSVRPIFVEYSTHTYRFYVPYDEAEKVETTHPVGYIAKESHGIWKSEGVHAYLVRTVFRLKDTCDKGTAWDTWHENVLETYVYDAQTWQGRGIGNSTWKSCFDKDYYSPDSDSTFQWGNMALDKGLFYERFSSGPTGPQEKDVLMNYYSVGSVQKM